MPTDSERIQQIDHGGYETDEQGNITYLSLFHKHIQDITFLENFKHLQRLDLRGNNITDITPLMGLKKLTHLLLSYNQITTLPEAVIDLDMEIKYQQDVQYDSGINLYHNPLQFPPYEIIMKGKEAVRAYFQSLRTKSKAPELHEIKVSLIGTRGTGKSSLARRLCGGNFEATDTISRGIHIQPWQFKDHDKNIYVHLWDFAGQEILHATHHYFFSRRGLYLLVLDGSDEEKNHCEYWLKHIESFCGEAPVLIIINKIDSVPYFDLNRTFLKRKYKNLKGFFRVSCKSSEGINDLMEGIKNELANMDILKTTWSPQWITVKNRLETLPEHYITYKQYQEICRTEGIANLPGQETLLDFLNDLGVVLHFKNLPREESLILESRWGTSALYRIINSRQLSKRKGILDVPLLYSILKKQDDHDFHYSPDTFRCLIELIKECELGYEPERGKLVIPGLLDVEEPPLPHHLQHALSFIIQYDFLPRSLMARFIVRMHQDIKDSCQWRSGVLLESPSLQATAVVRSDQRDRRLYISVFGKQKRMYFAVLRDTLHDIGSDFEKLDTIELVPLPEHPNITIPFDDLIGHELKAKDEIYVGRLRKSYKVKELLDGLITAEQRKEEIKKIAMAMAEAGEHFLTISQSHSTPATPVAPTVQEKTSEKHIANEIDDDFLQLETDFFMLKEMLEELSVEEHLSKQLEKIEDALDQVTVDMTPRELIFPLKKLGRLLRHLEREASPFHELLQETDGGKDLVKRMINGFNRLATHLALSPIPGA